MFICFTSAHLILLNISTSLKSKLGEDILSSLFYKMVAENSNCMFMILIIRIFLFIHLAQRLWLSKLTSCLLCFPTRLLKYIFFSLFWLNIIFCSYFDYNYWISTVMSLTSWLPKYLVLSKGTLFDALLLDWARVCQIYTLLKPHQGQISGTHD